jgi:predicted SnoaL-like aldol condensation-catalyzing enzyme
MDRFLLELDSIFSPCDLFQTMETAMNRRTVTMGLALTGLGTLAIEAAAQSGAKNPLIISFAKTLSAHDINGFAALFAEDYVNHQMSAAAPKPAPGVSAKQATVGYFAARLKGIPDLFVAIEATLASGDMAAASFVYTGTHQGVYFGVAPTGKALRFTSCDIFRIRDDKIAEHWGMGDIAGRLRDEAPSGWRNADFSSWHLADVPGTSDDV